MKIGLFTASMVALLAVPGALLAQPAEKFRIGFITDMSGVYSDLDGPGGLEAIRMAIADFGGKVLGREIEVVNADHQSKADIASARAREMVATQNIKMLIGGTNTAANLAMNSIMGESKRPFITVGGTSPRLTGEDCTPYTVGYMYDTAALAKSVGAAVTRSGGKSWFFLTADYTFGHSLEAETTAIVKQSGGSVLGSVRHPLAATDFSSFLLRAQTSGAEILGMANAGPDLVNSIKGANEFGLTKTMKMASLLMFVNDVHALGLDGAQGLLLTEAWYWDLNDETRKFGERFFAKTNKMPNGLQAAEYSAALTYLKAVAAAGTDDPDKVMATMKSMEIDDLYAKGKIRRDGRFVHDLYLMQTKTKAESKRPWDYLKLVSTVSGEEAFGSAPDPKCKIANS